MICRNCGMEVGTSRFCTNCGVRMEEERQWKCLQEFYKEFASDKSKMWIIWYMIMNFGGAVIDLLGLFGGNIFALIDIVVRLGVGFVILRFKNWKVALCGTIYGGAMLLVNVILYQDVSALLYVVVGGIATSKLHKLNILYDEYQVNRKIPETEI